MQSSAMGMTAASSTGSGSTTLRPKSFAMAEVAFAAYRAAFACAISNVSHGSALFCTVLFDHPGLEIHAQGNGLYSIARQPDIHPAIPFTEGIAAKRHPDVPAPREFFPYHID